MNCAIWHGDGIAAESCNSPCYYYYHYYSYIC